MKKFHILGVALVAMLASAILVSSALASQEALWLIKGADVTANTAATIGGELLLEDMKPPIGEAVDVLCSGTFVGTIGANGVDSVTLVEGLKGEDNKIICTYTKKGACEGTEVTVTAVNLPWSSELMLVSEKFVDLQKGTGGEPGYEVECKTIIGTLKDKCVAESAKEIGAEVTNGTEGAVAAFLESNSEVTPPGECSLGGKEQGLVAGSGVVKTATGEVTVSEP